MKTGFSFIKDSSLIALHHLADIMPSGIEIYSYFINNEKCLNLASIENGQIFQERIINEENQSFIKDFRKASKHNYSWIMKSDLPLLRKDLNISENKQFDIFNEENHLCLCLRINSSIDNENDVICIIFQPKLNVFGIETGSTQLNTEHKSVLASVLYKSIISVLNKAEADKRQLESLSEKTRDLISTSRSYKLKLEQSKEDYYRNISEIAANYLKEFSILLNREFVFSQECNELLKKYNGNPVRLKDRIQDAVQFAYNLNVADNYIIVIEEEYLDLTVSDMEAVSSVEKISFPLSNRTTGKLSAERKLDQYENALKKVLGMNKKPVGKELAEMLDPPITPAAITYYLKDNQKTINDLLNKHPARWSLLRNHFKPLQNIIPRRMSPENKIL